MRLLVLSHFFPYPGSEPFLVYESQFFTSTFDSVCVAALFGSKQPTYKISGLQVLPPVLPSPKSRWAIIGKGIFNFKSFSFHRSDFFNVWWKHPKTWYSLGLSILMSRAIRSSAAYKQLKVLINNGEPVILYSYWADHWTSSLPYLKKEIATGKIKIVIRAHGSDLTGAHQHGYRPFRTLVLSLCNTWYTVSEHGKQYLQNLYPQYAHKIVCSRLGVPGHGKGPVPSSFQTITLVSVSNVISLKRVALIFEILQQLNIEIIWHHFGDGSEMHNLKLKITEARQGLTVHLHGHVASDALVNFYVTQPVHAFINLSTREGLPVSIMEAFSFGIPVFATAVGGTPELVNNTNGYCINAQATQAELQNALEAFILQVSSTAQMRDNAYNTWSERVSSNNYIQFLKAIHD